jgi:hypothetical protein
VALEFFTAKKLYIFTAVYNFDIKTPQSEVPSWWQLPISVGLLVLFIIFKALYSAPLKTVRATKIVDKFEFGRFEKNG